MDDELGHDDDGPGASSQPATPSVAADEASTSLDTISIERTRLSFSISRVDDLVARRGGAT
jgi:hypothetical protein